jgi:predicted Zn-dependent protease with MMP-like domain
MPKRRRGSRRAPRPSQSARRHERFDDLVERALAAIPSPFRDSLREVAIVIEDEPTLAQLRDDEFGGDGLYGLYEGMPRTEWAADSVPLPNKITLFRLALEADFPDPDDLAEEVRQTVIHELAHHLGIDDERLDQLGVD